MKELLKTVLLFVLVVVAAFIVMSTKGHDTSFDWNKLKINSTLTEETFSYTLADSEFNGIYQNMVNNNTYIISGKREEGTYRLYFVKKVGIKMVVLRIDDLVIDSDGQARFSNNDGVSMVANYTSNGNQIIIKGAIGGVGDKSISGNYSKVKSIKVFSMAEMEI